MLLCPWFLVLIFSCGCLAQTLTQSRASMSRSPGKTGIIPCQVTGATVSNSEPLHWYQQKPGQPPTRILYIGDSVTRDPGFGNSFKARKVSNSEFQLVIEKLTHDQAAIYYCAYMLYTVCNRNRNSAQKARRAASQPEQRRRQRTPEGLALTPFRRVRSWGSDDSQRLSLYGSVGEGLCHQKNAAWPGRWGGREPHIVRLLERLIPRRGELSVNRWLPNPIDYASYKRAL
ncbi:uncharacterized protein LOC127574468 [Pristis pectinata]|uniref:uncharacterized protein LOC127574468 n=1 Tax=Pristis pectinata TaxID=685728 RepID=UPI00223D35C2|nr:uncharacterized protein LOC127574468 [Pristis pectinata]